MNTNHNPSYGRLKWKPLSAREAQHLNEQGVSSSIPQGPKFLNELPPDSAVYEPKQPITKKLKKLIDDYAYGGAFQSAILKVRQQRIPELDRIHNLCQFYY
ncbi:hypothetical protein [Microcystis aeruginosa]|uniref:hypothetical protein n=1 Tax=Microcystis aeruginosa TaxID=1126 RepID=UPI001D14BFD0|nr:hypothetical protein [Microcystis aeruginosa]